MKNIILKLLIYKTYRRHVRAQEPGGLEHGRRGTLAAGRWAGHSRHPRPRLKFINWTTMYRQLPQRKITLWVEEVTLKAIKNS